MINYFGYKYCLDTWIYCAIKLPAFLQYINQTVNNIKLSAVLAHKLLGIQLYPLSLKKLVFLQIIPLFEKEGDYFKTDRLLSQLKSFYQQAQE
jgi:hypothetical protein